MSSEQDLEPTIARLQAINEYEFEDFVAEFFEVDGWETTVTQDSQDGGIDVIVEQSSAFHRRAVVQAKRHSPGNKVGRPDVQQYASLLREDHENDMAVIMTTSAFTRGAYEYGRTYNVKLIDGAAIAGFITARDQHDLVDEYAPRADEIDPVSEVFPVQQGPRDEYYEERPMEFATQAFNQHSLLDAFNVIHEDRVGRVLVKSLGQLKEAIDEDEEEVPFEVLRSSPRILKPHWFDVEVSDELSTQINTHANLSLSPPKDAAVVCYNYRDSVTVCVLLPPANPVERQHLAYAEDCVDFICQTYDYNIGSISGMVIGGGFDCLTGSQSKLGRLTRGRFEVKTYSEILRRSVDSNRELLLAVRPYFEVSEDGEMIRKLDRLDSVLT